MISNQTLIIFFTSVSSILLSAGWLTLAYKTRIKENIIIATADTSNIDSSISNESIYKAENNYWNKEFSCQIKVNVKKQEKTYEKVECDIFQIKYSNNNSFFINKIFSSKKQVAEKIKNNENYAVEINSDIYKKFQINQIKEINIVNKENKINGRLKAVVDFDGKYSNGYANLLLGTINFEQAKTKNISNLICKHKNIKGEKISCSIYKFDPEVKKESLKYKIDFLNTKKIQNFNEIEKEKRFVLELNESTRYELNNQKKIMTNSIVEIYENTNNKDAIFKFKAEALMIGNISENKEKQVLFISY